ncbi:hypothetical protein DFAR_2400007 [Desulfarculales bacterium]
MTNNYGDLLDLYLERPDPGNTGRYLEDDQSLPALAGEPKILHVKDQEAPGAGARNPCRRTAHGEVR